MGRFFQILGINNDIQLKTFLKSSGVSVPRLKYYNESGVFPSGHDLQYILKAIGLNETGLRLRLGALNNLLLEAICQNAAEIHQLIGDLQDNHVKVDYNQIFTTQYGTMFQGDCLSLMDDMKKESIDLIFADPPFNLNKTYESGINDLRDENEYLAWTERWVLKCIDLLKDEGSIFIRHLHYLSVADTNFGRKQAESRYICPEKL